MTPSPWKLCVAPMMEWTDRHERYFLRLISPHARLYTEMVTAQAILRGNRLRLLQFNEEEHPVALQVGGADPDELARCTRISEDWGYDEINLNVGCPSDRVQAGRFGASLMRDPGLVAECLASMQAVATRPVTVKCRIGVDEQVPEDVLIAFVDRVRSAGISTIIIHARKAMLSGLSPKQNREVPPLNYDIVYQVKRAFPDATIVINGGIANAGDCRGHLDHVDGVMLGRAAYQTPYVLCGIDTDLYCSEQNRRSRREVVEAYVDYMSRQFASGVPVHAMSRHILGLFHGQAGARTWRRYISERAHRDDATPEIVLRALGHVMGCDDRSAA